ncbi:MAG TPA: hypothetical protein VN455_08270 [Methanotrichaceae archaeon]|nr:hypothetical protein [Methanotrichaceae archaeon]
MRLVNGMKLCFGLILLLVGSAGICAGATGGAHDPMGNSELNGINDFLYGAEPPKIDGAMGLFIGMKNAQDSHPEASSGDGSDTPVGIIFHNWKGFAIKGNDSRALRVSIESIRPIEPMSVRKLLASNMSIEEVRKVIREEEGAAINRGVMKLSDSVYKLMDIEMTPSGNNTLLEADLGELKHDAPENDTAVLGHLSVNLASGETADVSQGTLVVNSGSYGGKYKVLLDTQPPEHGERPESAGPMVPGCPGPSCIAPP